ncbi:hypothetical protein P691DRAFT_767755 [Macrolepiota fuliginosa MF-IS2]|uniref:Uncharacterized protein n=1 Tax=Macrolepiota fuliginosa MF-IS2 TaxID=1400762 RepID=A0A9P5X017_9AGAR|nr:hypothetical protein P691DRAFT_767755 [Macrolepiota fuliginosa MF-IS2]
MSTEDEQEANINQQDSGVSLFITTPTYETSIMPGNYHAPKDTLLEAKDDASNTDDVPKVLNFLLACVDVMFSNAWLNALGAVDLSQVCGQAVWNKDSLLKQIPWFEPKVINCCNGASVEMVYSIIEMEDDGHMKGMK